MVYKTRFLERIIKKAAASSAAVVVTGPRQAGKTSLLSTIGRKLFPDMETVSFDSPAEADEFGRDPGLFFINHPGVLLLDEIQHVPDIFPYLKREIDRHPGKFRFFISGSQVFPLMRHVAESLAGRAVILDLWPFCIQEAKDIPKSSDAGDTLALIEQPRLAARLKRNEFICSDRRDIVPAMLAGGYPKMLIHHAGSQWLESYRRTYIQRDIRDLAQVADLGKFDRFTVMLAGLSGTIVNKARIAQAVGIDNKTVDHWISILETSYQMIRLPAYARNPTKRLVKRPKYCFADSGLCLHLQGIRDSRALLNAPHFGQLFETFVIMEIRKLYGHAGRSWDAFYWRTPAGVECDLVLSAGGKVIPIEIKHGTTIRRDDWKGLNSFMAEHPQETSHGRLISLYPKIEQLDKKIWHLPIGALLHGVSG